jgi:SAM-dependent methyltransferase
MREVKTYFSQVADIYSKRSAKGLWSSLRQWESKAVIGFLPKTKGPWSALDLGCGAGFYSRVLSELGAGNILAVDFSKEMLKQFDLLSCAKVEADIEQFVVNETFEVIVCAGALEFTLAPERVFENAAKMMSTDGILVLLSPRNSIWGKMYRQYHRAHKIELRLFNEADLRSMSASAGLAIIGARDIFPFSRVTAFSKCR